MGREKIRQPTPWVDPNLVNPSLILVTQQPEPKVRETPKVPPQIEGEIWRIRAISQIFPKPKTPSPRPLATQGGQPSLKSVIFGTCVVFGPRPTYLYKKVDQSPSSKSVPSVVDHDLKLWG